MISCPSEGTSIICLMFWAWYIFVQIYTHTKPNLKIPIWLLISYMAMHAFFYSIHCVCFGVFWISLHVFPKIRIFKVLGAQCSLALYSSNCSLLIRWQIFDAKLNIVCWTNFRNLYWESGKVQDIEGFHLIECFYSIDNLCSNLSFIITQSRQYFKTKHKNWKVSMVNNQSPYN